MTAPNFQMLAAHIVLEVVDRGRALDDALADAPADAQPRLREIAAGGCRHFHTFDACLAALLHKPLSPGARIVHFLLINACHQIAHMRTPDYAAVSEAVGAVGGTRHAWAAGLINAVLRNFLRQRGKLKRELAQAAEADSGDGAGGADNEKAAAHFAMPVWFYREIRAHWPAHFRAILDAGNQKPPLTLRVNRRKIDRDAYLAQLAAAGIAAAATADSDLGVTLASPLPVARIPGFADGLASVQDESAQLALAALGPVAPAQQTAGVTGRETAGVTGRETAGVTGRETAGVTGRESAVRHRRAHRRAGETAGVTGRESAGVAEELTGARVLDACAAPGGKTGLLLEAGARVTAVDLPARIGPLRENLARLGFAGDGVGGDGGGGDGGDGDCGDGDGGADNATVIAGDLLDAGAWWDGAPFDCILLDVPCSGSGVIRRHPDIKHRRRPSDIEKFAAQQLQLLRAAWHMLAAGGALLYVTCSVLAAENDAVIAAFTGEQSDAAVRNIDAPGIAADHGVQRLPGVHPGDGFYFCRLHKIAPAASCADA